jgi:ATP synthase F1 complex assembly factor 1
MAATLLLKQRLFQPRYQYCAQISRRCLSFTFTGPNKLDDVLKIELLQDKTKAEVAAMWMQYHEDKPDTIGLVLQGGSNVGTEVLARASKAPFFISPVFRDDGFFNLVSQFHQPCHFFMAYLEDYKMDPISATPLVTFSVFDELKEHDLTLVRCEILNKALSEEEGYKVVESVLDSYRQDYENVETFNQQPNAFDIDSYISRMQIRWKAE